MFVYCPNCSAKLSSVDFNGFTCQSCQKRHYFNSKPATGIIPIFGQEILLAIRGVEPFKGHLDTIGGFLENGEDPIEGSYREFKEETGKEINRLDLKFLGIVVSDYYYDQGDYKVLNILYTIDFPEKLELIPSDDVAELVWINVGDLKNYSRSTKFMEQVERLVNSSSLS